MMALETLVLAMAQPAEPWLEPSTGRGFQMLVGSLVVLALLAASLWLLRRGTLNRRTTGAITIETAVPLGERRSLVIVSVEGRRLLIGLTPASVSFVTNLDPRASTFDQALEQVRRPVGEDA